MSETTEQLARQYVDMGFRAIEAGSLAHIQELKHRTMDLERALRINDKAGKPVINLFVRLNRVEETLCKIQEWWDDEYGELVQYD